MAYLFSLGDVDVDAAGWWKYKNSLNCSKNNEFFSETVESDRIQNDDWSCSAGVGWT